MSSNIKIGQKIRVTVRFVDFDPIAGTDDLLDPTSVSVALYKYDTTTSAFVFQSTITPVVQTGLGIYYVDWTPTENGRFRVLFTGSLPGATPSTVENPRDFYVGTATPTMTLGSTAEYVFLPELTPLYLDPEAVKDYYADADLVEVTEIIYRLSTQLETWFGVNLTLTSTMEEWILASTLCELSKIHVYDGGLGGFGAAESYTLGDLNVRRGSSSSKGRDAVYRGNVSNWCELAALLYDELTYSRVNMKSVVRGDAYPNPMPPRGIRRFD